jgi:hypothetical protein
VDLLGLLITLFIILGFGAGLVHDFRQSDRPWLFLAALIPPVVAGGYAAATDNEALGLGVLVAALLFDLVRRVRNRDARQEAVAPREESAPSRDEIAARAAAERAQRELNVRGSHPLGHPVQAGDFRTSSRFSS